jgi:hypothetical protein
MVSLIFSKRSASPIPLRCWLYYNCKALNTTRSQHHQLTQHTKHQLHQRRRLAHKAKDDDNSYTKDDSVIISPQDMASLQTKLLYEASYLTRALYRKCLRSIKLLAGANDRDEEDFTARESDRFEDQRISMMAPPVDRRNELRSRFEYYKTFARENFDGHFNLLGMHGFHIGDDGNMTHGLGGTSMKGRNRYQGEIRIASRNENQSSMDHNKQYDITRRNGDTLEHYMWREEQIDQFVYLIRSGEGKRKWILNDYGFEDVSSEENSDISDTNNRGWSQELENRLQTFEAQSKSLVREMYKQRGWLHSADYEKTDVDDDDSFFNDDDKDDGR